MTLEWSDLIGKVMLVGFTYYTHENVFLEQKQFWGRVTMASDSGIQIETNSGDVICIPPDLRSTKKAPSGEYRLRSTGEVVVDPDYLSTWNITKPE